MLKQANLNKLIIAALVSVMILSGCAAPTATAVPATAAPAATVAPAATTATAQQHRQPLPPQALPVEMSTYYGDTGPAAACVKTAAADFNAAQSQYVLNIRNLAFTDFNQQVTTAIAGGVTPNPNDRQQPR